MRIKICGVTTVADARAAAELGADAIGLNFYSGSPRCVSLGLAEELLLEVPPFVEPVAVLVKPTLNDLRLYHQQLGLRTLQIHGLDLEAMDIDALSTLLHSARLIVARGIASAEDVAETRAHLRSCLDSGIIPAAVLLDARVPGQHGGTGQCLPWHLLEGCQLGLPLILVGGLTPDNVAEAIRVVKPYAVDVASGVESSPGRKDIEKLRRFIGNARAAAES